MKGFQHILLAIIILVVVMLVFFTMSYHIKGVGINQSKKVEFMGKSIEMVPIKYDIMPKASIDCVSDEESIINEEDIINLVVKIRVKMEYQGFEPEFRAFPVIDIGVRQEKGNEMIFSENERTKTKTVAAEFALSSGMDYGDVNRQDFIDNLDFISITLWKSNDCTKEKWDNRDKSQNANNILLKNCMESYIGTWDFEVGEEPDLSECISCYKCSSPNSRAGMVCSYAECANLSHDKTNCYWDGSNCKLCEGMAEEKKDPYSCMMCHEGYYWDNSACSELPFPHEDCSKIEEKEKCIAYDNCTLWEGKCESIDSIDNTNLELCYKKSGLRNVEKDMCNLARGVDCYGITKSWLMVFERNECGPSYSCSSDSDCVEFCAIFGNLGNMENPVGGSNCKCINNKCNFEFGGSWFSEDWVTDDRTDVIKNWR